MYILVIEVYQEWAGKSIAMLTVFKDCLVKLEHDKMLKLVAAKADTIDSWRGIVVAVNPASVLCGWGPGCRGEGSKCPHPVQHRNRRAKERAQGSKW
ncbi:hypothetical protein EB796_016602 [Bugula neritina]|uniref:Uncharacterized protein n=1 Tax=Bugula neritina TaxID=10212 RepID=A0A7J7JHL8_BUGNE|nr:hypothetical protein EB796_016602 [Bugula neritina]